jgi:hypothetical protein
MQTANTLLSQWGPALLVCFTVVVGVFYQNRQMSDLKGSVNKRIDDLKGSIDKRFDDLKDYIKSEFKRVDERIDRLESPLARK